MIFFLMITISFFFILAFGLAQAASPQKGVCLKISGEKVEIHNLSSTPIVIDREGIPDFVPTSMIHSVSSSKESKSYNILLKGLKRNDKKAITSFELKIDEKSYSNPKDSCAK